MTEENDKTSVSDACLMLSDVNKKEVGGFL